MTSKITIVEIIFGSGPFLNEFRNHNEMMYAVIMPTSGAKKMNSIVLLLEIQFLWEVLASGVVDQLSTN